MPAAEKPMRKQPRMVVATVRDEPRGSKGAEGDAAEAEVDLQGVAHLFCEGVEGVDADQQADADHGADDAEGLGEGVQDVANVDGDERAEAAHDEHAGGQGDDDEEQRGVVEDEAGAYLHVGEDAGDAGLFLADGLSVGWSGRGVAGDDEGERGDEGAGGDEAGGVEEVADFCAEGADEEDGDGRRR